MNTEIKIRELENEIARLKSESKLNERLEHIKKKAEERAKTEEEEMGDFCDRYIDLCEGIAGLRDRILNIFKIKNELLKNGFTFKTRYNPTRNLIVMSSDKDKLCIDDVRWHRCRHIEVVPWLNDCDEEDIMVKTDFYTELRRVVCRGQFGYSTYAENYRAKKLALETCLKVMEDFLIDFDKFEEDFYNQIDNL